MCAIIRDEEKAALVPIVKDNPYLGEFDGHYRKKTLASEGASNDIRGIIARDSKGRIVQQYSANPFGSLASSRLIAVILEPVTEMLHIVDTESSTRLVSSPVRDAFSTAAGPVDSMGAASPSMFHVSAPTDTFIGEKVIEGMRCKGYRRLGSRGEEIEFWVADELQETVLARISSDSFESSFRLHDIRREEPKPGLLVIPARDISDQFDFHLTPL